MARTAGIHPGARGQKHQEHWKRPPKKWPRRDRGRIALWGLNGDGYIHAVDKDTGKILWETEIEGTPDGIPAVHEVDGREYVAFFAAGRGRNHRQENQTGGGTLQLFNSR